jgi:hypothetical protein
MTKWLCLITGSIAGGCARYLLTRLVGSLISLGLGYALFRMGMAIGRAV